MVFIIRPQGRWRRLLPAFITYHVGVIVKILFLALKPVLIETHIYIYIHLP